MRQPDKELRIKTETLTCRHFNGVQHDKCKAGVNYRALAGEPMLGCMTRVPCLSLGEPKHGPMATCVKREPWTLEEAAANVEAGERELQRHLSAFRAAHDDAKAKGLKRDHGGHGSCVCPICQGVINYSVASYNGHMHAACETKGCVSWME